MTSAGLPPPSSGLGVSPQPEGRRTPSAGPLRFAPCSCGSRKRVIVEAGGRLRGRCLRCGRHLGSPLATTRGAPSGFIGAPAPPGAGPQTCQATDSRPVVLIVDDDATIRGMLEIAVARLGVRTIAAADGVDALDLAHRCAPDVIVTDLAMPRLDGRQLIWCLRHTPWGRETPVVVFSGAPETPPEVLDQPGVVIAAKADGPGPVLDHLSRILPVRTTAARRARP
jgi:CheY-like chemotaxis protein